MAKKVILKDQNDIEVLPITRGELVLDASGNPALHSTQFLATDSQPGLMSSEDKYKLDHLEESGPEANNKVAQINTTTNDVYRLLFSETADDTDRTEKSRKSANLTFNPSTGVLNLTGAINANGGTLTNSLAVSAGTISSTRTSTRRAVFYKNASDSIDSGTYIVDVSDDGDAILKLTWNNLTWKNNTIWHSGNLKNLSDLNDDIVNGKYLPLTGGTISGNLTIRDGGYGNQLTIHRSSTTADSVIKFTNDTDGLLGYIGIGGSSSGSAKLQPYFNTGSASYPLIHSGNIGDQSVGTADKLKNKVKIWGQDFDGSEDVKGNLNLGYNKLYIGDGTNNFYIGWGANNTYHYCNYYGHYFSTKAGEIMSINSSGNVGIGTANPACKLDVDGRLRVSSWLLAGSYIWFSKGSEGIYITREGINWHNTNESWVSSLIGFSSSGVSIGQSTKIWGSLTTTGATTLSSTLSVTGTGTFNSQIISNVADGTAPLVVTSTTKVANLNTDLLDGFHVNTGSEGKCFGKIPVIGADGVTELGHYIDWHYDNTTVKDYSTRLQVSGNHGNIVNLPSKSGTLALTTDIPTITDYYWANVLISKTSNDKTTPTFGLTKIKGGADIGLDIYTSSGYGRIRFYNASNANNATIHYFENDYGGYSFVKDSLNLGCQGLVTLGGWNNPTLVVSGNTTTSNSDGKVGIGTTTPSERLHVVGSAYVTDQLTVGNSDDNKRIYLNGNTSSLRLFAWNSSTYIESGNKDFSANVPLYITGINGNNGSDLNLCFYHTTAKGVLHVHQTTVSGNYNEGIRLYGTSKSGSWSNIQFGCDTSSQNAAHADQWLIGRDTSNNFVIRRYNLTPHMTFTKAGSVDVVVPMNLTTVEHNLKIYKEYNYHPCLVDDAGRPGISISGRYPYIWLTGGGTANTAHGATITLCAPDVAAATDGKYKMWTFGVPGQGATWIDLAYSSNYANPHNGINDYHGGGSKHRIMRWRVSPQNQVLIYGTGTDGAASLEVSSSRTGTWIYGASFLAPNISTGHNIWINVGKANSTRNSFGLSWHHAGGNGSTSNYGAIEIYGVGNIQRWYADLHSEFMAYVRINTSTYPSLICNAQSGSESNIRFDIANVTKGFVGYNTSQGAWVYNAACAKYLALSDSGIPHVSGKQLAMCHAVSFNTDVEADDTTASSITDFFTRLNYSGLFSNYFGMCRGSWWYVGNTQYNTGVGTLEMAGTAVLNMSASADTGANYKSLLFLTAYGDLYSYASEESGVATWSRYSKEGHSHRVTKLHRSDASDDYYLRHYWTGSYWYLQGYYGSSYHAGVQVAYANNAGTSSAVTINYNNDSNSTYQMLWGSGNYVYGTGGIYCNPSSDYLYANSVVTSDWFRSTGNSGWFSNTHGGGIYMTDSTWVRIYNDKKFYVNNSSYDAIHSAGGVYVVGCVHSYANYLKSTCNGHTVTIGSMNSSWCHIETSAPQFYFNKSVQVQGHLYEYSDIRKKNIIQKLEDIDFSEASIVQFKWKHDPKEVHVGVIAQEIEELLPEVVNTDCDGYKSVDYGVLGTVSGVIAMKKISKLLEKVKELEKEIEILKNKN